MHGQDGKLPGYQITADDNADNWREEIVKIRNFILESKRNTVQGLKIPMSFTAKQARVIRHEMYGYGKSLIIKRRVGS